MLIGKKEICIIQPGRFDGYTEICSIFTCSSELQWAIQKRNHTLEYSFACHQEHTLEEDRLSKVGGMFALIRTGVSLIRSRLKDRWDRVLCREYECMCLVVSLPVKKLCFVNGCYTERETLSFNPKLPLTHWPYTTHAILKVLFFSFDIICSM